MENEELTLEEISFQIIASVGMARSVYGEAIQMAKAGDFEGAQKNMELAEESSVNGLHAHMNVLVKQANGETLPFDLLLVHAEGQMMNAEAFKTMAMEIIELYKKLDQ